MNFTRMFPMVPVYALRPGDVLGRTEVAACHFAHGEARITMASGYVLVFPDANEPIVLAAPSRQPELSAN